MDEPVRAAPPNPPGVGKATVRGRAWRRLLPALGGLIVVVAVVAVGALLLLPKPQPVGPTPPGRTSSAGILVPATGTPTNVAFQRTLGRPDAPVRLTVWSDFVCQVCSEFAQGSMQRLITDYVVPGKLRIEFKDDAIEDPSSTAAAAAARCANDQGKFWPYHDVLFANEATSAVIGLGPQRLKDMADAIGLDRTQFDACLPSGSVFNDIATETGEGKSRGSAVPLLDFGTVVLEGSPPYDQLQQTMTALLAAAPTPGPSGASATPPSSTP